jgi:hypothetical protein
MFDLLPTLFSEVQRETHQGVIGQPDADRQIYEVLYGTGTEVSQPPGPAPRPARPSPVASALRTLTALLQRRAHP